MKTISESINKLSNDVNKLSNLSNLSNNNIKDQLNTHNKLYERNKKLINKLNKIKTSFDDLCVDFDNDNKDNKDVDLCVDDDLCVDVDKDDKDVDKDDDNNIITKMLEIRDNYNTEEISLEDEIEIYKQLLLYNSKINKIINNNKINIINL